MAENNATEAQEPIKKAKAYKITSKAFEKRSEAAGEAAEAKIKGIAPVLVIEGVCTSCFIRRSQQRQQRKNC